MALLSLAFLACEQQHKQKRQQRKKKRRNTVLFERKPRFSVRERHDHSKVFRAKEKMMNVTSFPPAPAPTYSSPCPPYFGRRTVLESTEAHGWRYCMLWVILPLAHCFLTFAERRTALRPQAAASRSLVAGAVRNHPSSMVSERPYSTSQSAKQQQGVRSKKTLIL